MKIKALCFLLSGSLLALAAWLVRAPDGVISSHVEQNPAQADEVPEKYRETVQKGLGYLAKNQFKDGHWEGDGGNHPVAMTGLAGLAFIMLERDNSAVRRMMTVQDAKYTVNIRKAVNWLMDKSQAGRDGLIFSYHPSETARYMQGHGLATLFMAGACEDEADAARRAKLIEVLARAVNYIVKAQSSQGGWYNTSKVEGHDFDMISATVIQIQALHAAENAGIPVPIEVMSDAQEYLKIALGIYDDKAKPGQNRSRPADTAAALVCRLNSCPHSAEDEWCEKWFKYCQTEIAVGRDITFGRDELTHYYYAQAMFILGGDTIWSSERRVMLSFTPNSRNSWNGYSTAMFDHLQSIQNKDGSWPAGAGVCVGPAYSTAVWCSILQFDTRRHPSRRVYATK